MLKSKNTWFILGNFFVAVLVVILLIYLTINSLNKYTEHGNEIIVPNLIGKSKINAKNIASKKYLNTIIIDSIYSDSFPKGTVIEQYPFYGAKVKKGRNIQLTINSSAKEMVSIPSIHNISFRQTKQMLEGRGFKIGNIIYEPSDFKNLVLYIKHNQKILRTNTKLVKGSYIDIVLGIGRDGNNMVYSPNFFKMRLRDAINLAHDNYLNIGEVILDETVSNSNKYNAFIYAQNPKHISEDKVRAGSSFKVYVTYDETKLIKVEEIISNDTIVENIDL